MLEGSAAEAVACKCAAAGLVMPLPFAGVSDLASQYLRCIGLYYIYNAKTYAFMNA